MLFAEGKRQSNSCECAPEGDGFCNQDFGKRFLLFRSQSSAEKRKELSCPIQQARSPNSMTCAAGMGVGREAVQPKASTLCGGSQSAIREVEIRCLSDDNDPTVNAFRIIRRPGRASRSFGKIDLRPDANTRQQNPADPKQTVRCLRLCWHPILSRRSRVRITRPSFFARFLEGEFIIMAGVKTVLVASFPTEGSGGQEGINSNAKLIFCLLVPSCRLAVQFTKASGNLIAQFPSSIQRMRYRRMEH